MGKTITTLEVALIGDINSESARETIGSLLEADNDSSISDVAIRLCSGGGDEYEGWAIVDAIHLCTKPVRVIGYGQVASIAAAILQVGHKRELTPNARMMIHEGWAATNKRTPSHELIAQGREQLINNQRYVSLLALRSNLSHRRLAKMVRAETWLSAPEALRFKLIDSITGMPAED